MPHDPRVTAYALELSGFVLISDNAVSGVSPHHGQRRDQDDHRSGWSALPLQTGRLAVRLGRGFHHGDDVVFPLWQAPPARLAEGPQAARPHAVRLRAVVQGTGRSGEEQGLNAHPGTQEKACGDPAGLFSSNTYKKVSIPRPAARRENGPPPMPKEATHGAIDAVWRIESAKIIAVVARMVRDVGVAEELAQDALVTALEQWPAKGVPDKPAAWLMATAKNRALDWLRRGQLIERKHEELGHEIEARQEDIVPGIEIADEDEVGDDLLRLVFVACHPVLSPEARVALTLRLLGGLTTDEIARAFLVPEATVAQRIVRAKRTLSEARVPFEVPRRDELPARLASVLDVIYLIFNEGYSATAGEDWVRPALCEEALRLGRILAELTPQEAEVHRLGALLEIQASPLPARGRA